MPGDGLRKEPVARGHAVVLLGDMPDERALNPGAVHAGEQFVRARRRTRDGVRGEPDEAVAVEEPHPFMLHIQVERKMPSS